MTRRFKKTRKYKNTKVALDGHKFDSKKEANRYLELKQLLKNSVISELKLQPVFRLVDAVKLEGKTKPAVKYIADFSYKLNGFLVVEDVKSEYTRKLAIYRLKKHLMKAVHGVEVVEV